MKDIINELWLEVEAGKHKKIYNWLNEDNLGSIMVDGKVFWFELYPLSSMPNYVYEYLKKWASKKGYTYLYDLKFS